MVKTKEFLKVLALLVLCAGVPVIGWELSKILPDSIGRETPSPTYSELVAIVLSAVTVVLAVLAIIIATLAVWGYQSIKNEAAGAADRAVKATVADSIRKHLSDSTLAKHVAKEVRRYLGSEMLRGVSGYPEAFGADDPASPQPKGTVGAEYPKEEDDNVKPTG